MKMKFFTLFIAAFALMVACAPKEDRHGNYVIKNNQIVFDEPQRAEGQQSVLQFAVDPIENVRIGYIGLGMRGSDAVDRMTYIDGVSINALCDIVPDRVEQVQKDFLEARGLPRAAAYS